VSATKSLLSIDKLLRIYVLAEPQFVDPNVPADAWLIDQGLVQRGACGVWESTERGRVYCEAIRKVPLPIHQWVMPPEERTS
jgi:hypothetical protein